MLYPLEIKAQERIGLVFDVQGNVEVRSHNGKVIKLKRSEHLLYPIKDGDRIRVAEGKLVVVSMTENNGYEMTSGTEGMVKGKKIIATIGKVREVKGLQPPGEGTRGSIGGLVLRGVKPCTRAIAPLNTALIDLTPELVWDNRCPGGKKVFVKVISGEEVVFTAETEQNSVKIPESILSYGKEYRWMVDSLKGYDVGSFSIHDGNEVKKIKENIAYFKTRSNDIIYRLSYVFYLLDKNLNLLAKEEINNLNAEYPQNVYIQELVKDIK
jgi:hypothetical protein